MRSIFNRSTSTVLTRATLSSLATILFLPASAPAQLFQYDTRYQQVDSFGYTQVPVPIFYAQPEPLPVQQTFPATIQQHVDFPPLDQTRPMFSGDFSNGVAYPIVEGVQEIQPTLSSEVTMPPVFEAGSAGSVLGSQAIPEGYDPAYPIEYPGPSFQGYYPTDRGVVAPPVEHAYADDSLAVAPSMPNQALTVPSVVIEGEGMEVVTPEPGAITEEGLADLTNVPALAEEVADTGVRSSNTTEVEDTNTSATDGSVADDVNQLKQQILEAQLRAKEAEEKAHAIARQAASNQKKMAQLQTALAKSKRAMERMKAQAESRQAPLDAEKKAATVAASNAQDAAATLAAAATSRSETVQSDSGSDTIQLDLKADQLTEATKDAPAAVDNKRSVVENGLADSSGKESSKDSGRAASTDQSKKQTLREKISALEAAREKQLRSAAERIESEFQKKIDASLESGKTEKHPEVQRLKESLRERLDESNGKIRRRYQRQINRMWKEAAARSRS